MDLGEFYPCLKVQDIEQSIRFYQKLGFRLIDDRVNRTKVRKVS